jgi:hypothetical protein
MKSDDRERLSAAALELITIRGAAASEFAATIGELAGRFSGRIVLDELGCPCIPAHATLELYESERKKAHEMLCQKERCERAHERRRAELAKSQQAERERSERTRAYYQANPERDYLTHVASAGLRSAGGK